MGTAATVILPGGDLKFTLGFVEFLLELAPSDVVLVPLIWQGFPSEGPVAQAPDVEAAQNWMVAPEVWAREPDILDPDAVHRALRDRYWHPFELPGLFADVVRYQYPRIARAMRNPTPRVVSAPEMTPVPHHSATDFRRPPPPEVIATLSYRRQLYYERMGNLPTSRAVPGPQARRWLETTRAKGNAANATVLYYLSPHHPGYLETLIAPQAFADFRAALGPALFADLGALLPEEHFSGDFIHFDAAGGHLVAQALAQQLRKSALPPSDRTPQTPPRFYTVRHTTAAFLSTATMARTRRRLGPLIVQLRNELHEYPRYIKTILGTRGLPPSDDHKAPAH